MVYLIVALICSCLLIQAVAAGPVAVKFNMSDPDVKAAIEGTSGEGIGVGFTNQGLGACEDCTFKSLTKDQYKFYAEQKMLTKPGRFLLK
jgi:hypothetical protein